MTIARLAQLTASNHPVIVAMQAWPDTPRTHFGDDWDDGHYVVVLSVSRRRVRFEDPSLLGSRGELRKAEFIDRWHDSDGQHRYVHYGLWLDGRAPSPPPAARPIDCKDRWLGRRRQRSQNDPGDDDGEREASDSAFPTAGGHHCGQRRHGDAGTDRQWIAMAQPAHEQRAQQKQRESQAAGEHDRERETEHEASL